ncbi:MAG: ABC transporter permease [Nanoarchaeota archaeon]
MGQAIRLSERNHGCSCQRVSIVIGRVLGGATTSLAQGIMILIIGLLVGFQITSILGFFISILFMLLLSATFIGIGLIIASKMKDMQGFQLIVNFLVLPLVFLSGALFPVDNLPGFVKTLTYLNPITYGVDGIRASLIGVSSLPILYNLAALIVFSSVMVFLGAYFFDRSDNV